MICIFSTTRDQTTTEVIRWLAHLGVSDIIRINSDRSEADDSVIELNIDQNALSFRHHGRLVQLSDLDAVWYRKGRRWLCNSFREVLFEHNPVLAQYLKERIGREELRLAEYVHFLIESSTPILGSSSNGDLNKLLVLRAANAVGLLTPSFRVSTRKSALIEQAASAPHITKPITDVLYLFDAEKTETGYFSYTEKVEPSDLQGLPDHVSPSFIQEQIVKRCDVRVFFLDGLCYPMAIFSQRDEQTQVDFRRYNYLRPNRAVPLRLPPDIEARLIQLFANLQLDTGSADFIIDEQGNYFFLEINPVGQFSMVSAPCNYLLERQVALTLRKLCKTKSPDLAAV